MEHLTTEQFDDWKSVYFIGETTWNPNYTPGTDFLDHDFL